VLFISHVLNQLCFLKKKNLVVDDQYGNFFMANFDTGVLESRVAVDRDQTYKISHYPVNNCNCICIC